MAIFIALVIHEIAHLFSAIILNIKFDKVKITLFGFNINADLDNVSLFKKIILFFSGPLCNIFLYIVLRNSSYNSFAEINFFLAFVNLIPIVPLDGGNICKSILEYFLNSKVVSRYIIMTNSFFIVCFLIIIYRYKIWVYLLLIIMGLKGIIEENMILLEKNIKVSYYKNKRKKYFNG